MLIITIIACVGLHTVVIILINIVYVYFIANDNWQLIEKKDHVYSTLVLGANLLISIIIYVIMVNFSTVILCD